MKNLSILISSVGGV